MLFAQTRLQQCYNDDVAFDFSSAFSISPSHVNTAAMVSASKDSNKEDIDRVGTIGRTQSNSYAAPEDGGELPPLLLPAISPPSNMFELGMCLCCYDSAGQTETGGNYARWLHSHSAATRWDPPERT